MLKVLIEIFAVLIKEELFRRLMFVFLLPNVLVIGFSMIDIDNDRNILWHALVGPYWFIEKFVFCAVVGLFALSILIPVSKFILFEIVLPLTGYLIEKYNERGSSEASSQNIVYADSSQFLPAVSLAPTKSPEEQALAEKQRQERKSQEYAQYIAKVSLIGKWIEIYQSKTTSELPEVQMQSRKLELEFQTISKRKANLIQRIAELPSDIPVDEFYEQLKQMTARQNEIKLAKENLKTKEMDLKAQEIDEEGLKLKIENVIKNLEKAPKDKQRPIFTNLIKFIEINPMKIKMGIYAPVKETMKATGTDGLPPVQSENSNFVFSKDADILSFPSNRVGSSSVGNGAPGRT